MKQGSWYDSPQALVSLAEPLISTGWNLKLKLGALIPGIEYSILLG